MIPYSNVSGTFYNASGVARAGAIITFVPLSTPYSLDGELVLSMPQLVTLNNLGQLHNGAGQLYYQLAKGYYRVVASDTDAFFISVPGDGLVYNIDTLANELGSVPAELQRIVTSQEIWNSSKDSVTVKRSMVGDISGHGWRLMFIGESDDLSADTKFPGFGVSAGTIEMVVLGNANPGGSASTITNSLSPWLQYIDNTGAEFQHFWYPLGSEDWLPGNVSAVLNYLTFPGVRYYKQSFMVEDGTTIALFVIDSNDSEPDGNTSISVQATWLRDQLATASERWKIVTFRDSPFVSVIGKAKTAMDWPFAEWGAHVVVAAGAKVMERFTLSGNIPLYVTGCAGTGAKDAFNTSYENSVFQRTNVRAALVITIAMRKLVCHVVNMDTGAILDQTTITGASNQPITWSVNYDMFSGFRAGVTTNGLELEAFGVSSFHFLSSNKIERLMDKDIGYVMRFPRVPLEGDAVLYPWMKNCIIAVGDDPTQFYWWNAALGAFVVARFMAFDGVSYFNGTRVKLSAPTFTPLPGTGTYGIVVDHPDSTVEIYISSHGDEFVQFGDWPTNKLFMLPAPRFGESTYMAAFARKAGFLDSDITAGPYFLG